MQKITTFLSFNDRAEEAVNLYTSIFKNSKIGSKSYYSEGAPLPAGTLLTISFQLDGQDFVAMNGGPHFSFTDAISLVVSCDTQAELDAYWEQLSAGGEKRECGWLKDKFGLSWQIIPSPLMRMISDEDPAKSQRVMAALMQMTKLDLKTLEQAYEG